MKELLHYTDERAVTQMKEEQRSGVQAVVQDAKIEFAATTITSTSNTTEISGREGGGEWGRRGEEGAGDAHIQFIFACSPPPPQQSRPMFSIKPVTQRVTCDV